MTSPTSAATNRTAVAGNAPEVAHRRPRRGARRRGGGFTLIEILVVIGIMVLLVALLMPIVMKAYGKATNVRMAADLAAISAALEAYRQDHFAYPMVRRISDPSFATPGPADRPNPPTGAQILCQALIGPAQAVDPMPVANARLKQDGLDGPGFRTRAGGKPYPPYLNPEQFKIGRPFTEPLDTSQASVLLFCILDRNDYPILYFPASPTKPNVRMSSATNPAPYIDNSATSAAPEAHRFDLLDNLNYIDPGDPATSLLKMRLLFGDRNANGYIDGEDVPVDLPFALWCAGSNDHFGPQPGDAPDRTVRDWADVAKCDDVTNFRQ